MTPARIVLAVVVCAAAGAPAAAAGDDGRYPVHGSYAVRGDWRFADPAADRRDADATADLDIRFGDSRRHRLTGAFTGRVAGDLDGRRPADRPNVYDGVQETFEGLAQPYVYRGYVEWRGWSAFEERFEAEEGAVVRLGRQYGTGGENVWFDGAAVEWDGEIPVFARPAEVALYGGVPVRLLESAAGDWMLGGRAAFDVGRGRVALEYLHVTDDLRDGAGRTRNENLVRLDVRMPVGERGDVVGAVRAIDAGEVDYRALARLPGPRDSTFRVGVRGLAGERKRLANELDAFSVVLGRAVGAPRSAYVQPEVGLTFPLTAKVDVDMGVTRRWTSGADDIANADYGRVWTSFLLSGLTLGRLPIDGTITLEGYETRGDFTRTASGEIGIGLSDSLRLSLGTAYAIYQYDYSTGTVRDDVRTGTARLDWNAAEDLRVDVRYDIENDDERLHHYVRAGARRAF